MYDVCVDWRPGVCPPYSAFGTEAYAVLRYSCQQHVLPSCMPVMWELQASTPLPEISMHLGNCAGQ